MKKFIAIFLFLSILGVNIYSIPSPIQLTFDPKNWLTAIDSLYAIYDQIKTNIEQLNLIKSNGMEILIFEMKFLILPDLLIDNYQIFEICRVA